jgi:hypothetical protein
MLRSPMKKIVLFGQARAWKCDTRTAKRAGPDDRSAMVAIYALYDAADSPNSRRKTKRLVISTLREFIAQPILECGSR